MAISYRVLLIQVSANSINFFLNLINYSQMQNYFIISAAYGTSLQNI